MLDKLFTEINKKALFFDFDGTLVDIAPTPDSIIVPKNLSQILSRLNFRSGALAIITGRTIGEIDKFIAGHFNIAGVYGCEIRYEQKSKILAPKCNIEQIIDQIKSAIKPIEHKGLLLENKGYSAALHYRAYKKISTQEQEMLVKLMARYCPPQYQLLLGKCVIEIKPKNIDKGFALDHFMRQPKFQGKIPLCFGDDLSDQKMFTAAQKYDGHICQMNGQLTPSKLVNFLSSFTAI